jgi:ornithine carbamoyltransferase
MSNADTQSVLQQAESLQRAAMSGRRHDSLRGKKLALLCETIGSADAALFQRAAAELGAHVSRVRPNLWEQMRVDDLRDTAQLLGRLYDAVECQGIAGELVERLRRHAGVPVFDGLATPAHPSAGLSARLEGDADLADKRRFMLQAMLVAAVT